MIGGALVVGEALIDEVVEADHTARFPGGSPANVAIGLSRLSVPTRLHTAIGSDEDGALIRHHLEDAGVDVTMESTTTAPTSRAIATLAPDRSASYEFALSWEPIDLTDLGSPEVIHTGSLAAFLEPGAQVVDGLVRRGRAGGALVTFDPNIRPALVRDPSRALTVFTNIASSSHLTKLSDEDAEFLLPGRSVDEVLDMLVGGGVAVAAVTQGSRGALLASGEHRVQVAPVTTVVADTVGAGDSFMAALIWALIFDGGGWDGGSIPASRLAHVGATAARAAAITVSRPGADLPSLREILEEPTDVQR